MNSQNAITLGSLLRSKRLTIVPITLVTLSLVGCGDNPPFSSDGPPPTFAIHWTISATNRILIPEYSGSELSGLYTGIAIVGAQFPPSGSTRAFGPDYISFGSYYVVDQGYWPGHWAIGSSGGCGQGTSQDVPVTSKIVEGQCVPRLLPLQVSPASYDGDNPPLSLDVTWDSSAIPGGASARCRMVNDSDGTLVEDDPVVLDGSGYMSMTAPQTTQGYYYVTFDFADTGQSPNGYDGAASGRVYVHTSCVSTPSHVCS